MCGNWQGENAQPPGRPAKAFKRTQPSQVQHVALRMAAAQSVGQRRKGREQGYRESVVAAPERDQRAASGQGRRERESNTARSTGTGGAKTD